LPLLNDHNGIKWKASHTFGSACLHKLQQSHCARSILHRQRGQEQNEHSSSPFMLQWRWFSPKHLLAKEFSVSVNGLFITSQVCCPLLSA